MRIEERDRPFLHVLWVIALLLFVYLIILAFAPLLQVENCPVQSADGEQNRQVHQQVSFWVKTYCDPVAYFTLWLTVFSALTFVTGYFTLSALRRANITSERTSEHFRVSERAYVKMSHFTPKEGFALTWDHSKAGTFDVVVEIKNHGNTPARITGIHLTCGVVIGEEIVPPLEDGLKDSPELEGELRGFLVKDDSFHRGGPYSIPPEYFPRVESGELPLLFLGYVDYIDQFDRHYRAGYAREYVPKSQSRNNLHYPSFGGGLNFDRERRVGEGKDWGTTS